MTILICGGAGYIGSHCVEKCIQQKLDVVVLDNLSTGHIEAIPNSVKFYYGDLLDSNILSKIFIENKIETVLHFAASSIVSESMTDMFFYYKNNVSAAINLLDMMNKFNIINLIFSSTAAVYGLPRNEVIFEFDKIDPINIYGETKYNVEKIIEWSSKLNNLNYIILRYFNVAGASNSKLIGESHRNETHLIPIIINSVLNDTSFSLFGNTHDALDGTCIRDYIHIDDIINAHLLSINMISKIKCNFICNLGNKNGISIKQLISVFEDIFNKKIKYTVVDKKIGDPPRLVASNTQAEKKLGWVPQKSIIEILLSAMEWQKNKLF